MLHIASKRRGYLNGDSRAVKPMYCALCDKSMKFCTQVMHPISFWFGYRTALDLTFGDLCTLFLSKKRWPFLFLLKSVHD